MKINYYTKHFSFRLSIFIAYFLLSACSKLGKLGNRYDGIYSELDDRYKDPCKSCDKVYMKTDEGYGSGSEYYDNPPFFWTQELFKAIEKNDIDHVWCLLKTLSFDPKDKWEDKITSFAPKDMSTCLHIVAAIQNPQAVDIMKLLLDKMKPLLLNKKDRVILLLEEKRLEEFVQGSNLWNKSTIENGLKVPGYNNSALLNTNHEKETPLTIAAKRGREDMFILLLEYTHRCVGLDHTDHLDEEQNDVFDILLKQESNDKLERFIFELSRCSNRCTNKAFTHFSVMDKCNSDAVVRAIISSKKNSYTFLEPFITINYND